MIAGGAVRAVVEAAGVKDILSKVLGTSNQASNVYASLEALKGEGINKVALVVFSENYIGNKFWECQEFTQRDDLIYRNKALVNSLRIDT